MVDVTIDFQNNQIIIPPVAPQKTSTPPNMCFSSQMNFLAKGVIHANPVPMSIDSGNASCGSLGRKFFEENKDYVTSHSELDTIRSAGIGGVHNS